MLLSSSNLQTPFVNELEADTYSCHSTVRRVHLERDFHVHGRLHESIDLCRDFCSALENTPKQAGSTYLGQGSFPSQLSIQGEQAVFGFSLAKI